MSNQYTSTVYHVAHLGQLPPGELIGAQDRPGGICDVYLHPQHVQPELVWDLNGIMRHQVGNGLWRQRWTYPGSILRMQQPAQGLGIAVSRWEIVPASAMPRRRTVLPVEEYGSCIWLISEDVCTREMRDAMNHMLERIAGDGLWLQYWYEHRERLSEGPRSPLLAPPELPLFV